MRGTIVFGDIKYSSASDLQKAIKAFEADGLIRDGQWTNDEKNAVVTDGRVLCIPLAFYKNAETIISKGLDGAESYEIRFGSLKVAKEIYLHSGKHKEISLNPSSYLHRLGHSKSDIEEGIRQNNNEWIPHALKEAVLNGFRYAASGA